MHQQKLDEEISTEIDGALCLVYGPRLSAFGGFFRNKKYATHCSYEEGYHAVQA